jgi:hypothetical protein
MSVGTGRQNVTILFWKQHFHFWEYISGNQTFILDSHQPFICSAVPSLCLLYIARKVSMNVLDSFRYEGNTEEKNNGFVFFK